MWEVDNSTPFPHHGGFLRDQAGVSLWCVHLKATFEIRSGKPLLFASEQEPIHHAAVFEDDNVEAAMLAETDISLPKDQADILLDGFAYPPANADAANNPYLATAKVGGWSKSLQINPPSVWSRWTGASIDDTTPVAPVRLRYSSAFGGPDNDDNPVGFSAYPSWGDAKGQPVAPLSPVGHIAENATKPGPAAGFGPVPRHWPSRRKFAGTYDAAWQKRRSPFLPKDLKPQFWQAAPADQRMDAADIEGAAIELTNMSSPNDLAAGPPITATLPRLTFEISTRFRGRWIANEFILQTLFIDAAKMRVSLSYLATMPIEATQNDVLVERSFVALRSHEGFRVRPEDVERFGTTSDFNAPLQQQEAS